MSRTSMGAIACAVAVLGIAARASAFCGFYVAGAEGSLFNEATVVVMMRVGTTTVLSMQNDYRGPPESFAMVVPVPTVLQQENVRTLEHAVFDRVDQLAAPRLVEYWEQDPCPRPMRRMRSAPGGSRAFDGLGGMAASGAGRLGVRIEAQFAVGEYDIVILSAEDSTGLDTWLRQENYHIPPGAGEVLRPYVEQGTKFFVARVDVSRVRFQNGRALLSPLRVHYDTPEFTLPVRLGLLNSSGTQDLIVHILSPSQRFEAANYPNAFIPTNFEVRNGVRDRFGAFYNALFDRTLARNRGAVITEYSWDAQSCDPCPSPPLSPSELNVLGADVTHGQRFTLSRLHYRYTATSLGEDLVFREASPVVGGRGVPGPRGEMDQGASPSSGNFFQGRYAILHRWTGPVECRHPQRGNWGGPPDGRAPHTSATRLTQAPRSFDLERFIRRPVPSIDLRPRAPGGGGGRGAPTPSDPQALGPVATPDVVQAGLGGGWMESVAFAFCALVLGLTIARRRR